MSEPTTTTLFDGHHGLVVGDTLKFYEALPGILVQFFGQTFLLGWPWKIARWRSRQFSGVYYVTAVTNNSFRIE